MANKSLFPSLPGRLLPDTDARNDAGGRAYGFNARHALAQYAATGCLNHTFYASAERQLDDIVNLADSVEVELVARAALHARRQGHMKDLPALLCAVLSMKSPDLLERIFDHVIDNGKMLRNFVQIVRSGAVARKSLGSLPKRLVERWLAARSDEELFAASVGNAPSLGDVIRMVHPRPATPARSALYAYFLGRNANRGSLPALVQAYEEHKTNPGSVAPDVPFQLLTSLPLSKERWGDIARNASWQTTRMNLNTFARHGAFTIAGVTTAVARKLRDRGAIRKTRVFPYQILMAIKSVAAIVPRPVKDALEDALEAALENVPVLNDKVYVCPDVSGSMHSPVTGRRRGATTAVRCVDVAALVAAAFLRRNPAAEVLPFEERVLPVRLKARDSVSTNAEKLASIGGGGTSCSAPLQKLNALRARGGLVLLVSDNQSWVDARASRDTETMAQWCVFKARNPAARLVCLDLQPNATTQAVERDDILNIGGFSDHVFQLIADFAHGRLGDGHWLGIVESIELPPPRGDN